MTPILKTYQFTPIFHKFEWKNPRKKMKNQFYPHFPRCHHLVSPPHPCKLPHLGKIILIFPTNLQCLQSSLSQNGGDNLRHHCSEKFQTTLKAWMGRLQLLPKIFETVLRPIWWVAGTEQPSPPLHRATAAQLLS